MADNSSIPVAVGNETFANKDIGGVKFPRHITVDSTGADVAVATAAGQTAIVSAVNAIPAAPTTVTANLGTIAGVATASLQGTANTSLASIDGKTPALGQALAAASVPVILPAATITTLTPPTTVTANLGTIAGVATAANQSTANTSLATLAGAVSSAKVATKAASGDFADGAINTLGARTDAKSTATDATSVSAMQVLKQISASVQGTLTVGSHAVTVSAGSALMGKVTIGNGTVDATIRAGSAAAVVTDPALVVTMRPDGMADPFSEYEVVAASQTDAPLGASGATGDYLSAIWIFPATAACGAVTIKDGATTIYTFPGGGTTALPSLAPIPWMPGIKSKNGAFTVTTGANVSVMGVGDFT